MLFLCMKNHYVSWEWVATARCGQNKKSNFGLKLGGNVAPFGETNLRHFTPYLRFNEVKLNFVGCNSTCKPPLLVVSNPWNAPMWPLYTLICLYPCCARLGWATWVCKSRKIPIHRVTLPKNRNWQHRTGVKPPTFYGLQTLKTPKVPPKCP